MTPDRRRFNSIPRRQRNAVRAVARDLLFERHRDGIAFDFDAAESLARERVRAIVGPILIGLAVQLIIAMLKHWLANRVAEPTAIFEIGEPGNYEMSEADDAT